jgi:phage gp29-like protein
MAKKSGKSGAKTSGVKTKAPRAARAVTKSKKQVAAKPTAKTAAKPAARQAVAAKAAAAHTRDCLDDFIDAAALALDLPVEPQWLPAIKANLQVTLRQAALVTEFALPDDAEPAPVFEA